MGPGRRSLMAAYSYLIMGTIGGTFVLLGIGLLYQLTGTLNLVELSERLPAVMDGRSTKVGFAFLFVGISIKLAVFPLHQWLPNAYTYAPAKVSAFLAGTATKVSYYLLLRVVFTVTLPLVLPAIASGALLTFMIGLASFGVPYLIGNPGGVKVLTTSIYAAIDVGTEEHLSKAVALSLVLAVVAALALLANRWLVQRYRAAWPGVRPPSRCTRWRAEPGRPGLRSARFRPI